MSAVFQSTTNTMIHETADVHPTAQVGPATRIWHQVQVREGARLGANCIVGKGAYIDFDVAIGDNVKIQNGALIYHGVTIEDGAFIGPQACLTNDKLPRAINPDGTLKQDADWEVGRILVRYGASIGAGAIVLPDVTIGPFAMVGAGALVTQNVPAHGLVLGTPARLAGYVCKCGRRLIEQQNGWWCRACQFMYDLEEGIASSNVIPRSGSDEESL